ncbi:two-component sensor histidine kinase [[Clostridium] sordellii]|uniref:histidine kinase n=1 Tax=Paraclostridium sordellii TaxID=1505 RepID=A0ABP1XNC1_PARSO|nr:sensor histidine kinase [Paeniclostridium sordellii]CEJ72684.1 Two-component sensor histidine kinase [[Clostridium] sordellii] [Paeniclostridium sordellii]CEN68237.1 two-component sensor histidine kinase [[Clostridium] sordellii] [Paeniclostridium sordellii]CEN71504.1 two-component sensor histidine kinase [[Clostridium] sordellii] [Paeniclostridium sordellii]CEO21564.1 two-component sensor histidine kinase [[Clostridium] sordellii] [Paeniclostridium sordellii]CEP76903.1 two-component sensor
MDIKLKKLLINNPVFKFVSLFVLFISLSILFEGCFNIMFNFLGESPTDFIPKYYLFGPVDELSKYALINIQKKIIFISSIVSLICFFIYVFNRKAKNILIDYMVNIFSKTPIEVILFIIIFIFLSRFDEWKHTMPFYDSDLVYCDSIILWIIYFIFNSFKNCNTPIKSRLLVIPIINTLNNKYHQHHLTQKLGLLFIIALIVQFILLFLSLNTIYPYSSSSLIESLLICFISSICYAYIYKKIEGKIDYIEYIELNIKDIENGNLKSKLDVIGNDDLASIATSINNIGEGLDKALETQLKNEKMKTELITNVSHDLKTPLTSIVSYIDILKNNELDNQTTKNYLNILDKKAYRLKNLVEDIFEASKISSGDIELYFEKTDIKELLIQSIVELDDKIESSKLDFIVNTPNEPIFTNIDGKRMFRVFDNLISNIVKYSLSNTRVYIDMYTDCGNVLITMKNISNHKLNITPDELVERFVRGDVSRNTSGSGLGLSIAKNLVNMQGGNLELDIDGDLFKVKLKFKVIQNLNKFTI